MLVPDPYPLKIGLENDRYALRTLLVYDRFVDATLGMTLMKRLCEQLQNQFQIGIDALKFNLLAHSSARQAAIEMADLADLIFLAASGRTDLPPHVASWIAGWSRKPSDPRALIAVFDEQSSSESSMVRSYLSKIAAQAGMQFFCNLEGLMPAHMIPRSHLVSSRDTTMHDWGLNEC